MIFSLKPLFWAKKVVIWWLFNDNLSAREQEREEKKNQKFCALKFLKCAYFNWGTSYICRTTVGVFGLGRFKIIFWLQIIGLQVICIMCILRNCNYHAHQSNFGKAAAKAIVCKSFSELSPLVQLVTMGALRHTHAHPLGIGRNKNYFVIKMNPYSIFVPL